MGLFLSMLKSRLAVSLFFFLHGLCFASWGGRIPDISTFHHLSEGTLGTLLLMLPVGSILSMPIASYLTSRLGSKIVLSIAIPLYASALVLVGFAPTLPLLVASLILFGLVSNHVNVSLNTQAIKLESLYKRPIMASLHGLWSLAGFVGAGFGGLMIKLNMLPFEHFMFVAVLAYLATAFMCRHLIVDSGKKRMGNKFSFKLPSKEVAILGLIAFLSMLCEGAMFDWAGVYFKKVLGIEGAMMTAGYVAFMSTMAGTRFVADFFKEKIGFRKILLHSGLLVFSGLMIATGFNNLISCIIGFLMVGSGVSAVVPLTFSESGRVSPENPSGTVAIISTIGFLGFLFGPPAIGWIAEISSLRFSFFLIGIIGLVMGISHLFLPKRK